MVEPPTSDRARDVQKLNQKWCELEEERSMTIMHIVTFWAGPERSLLALWLQQMSAMLLVDETEYVVHVMAEPAPDIPLGRRQPTGGVRWQYGTRQKVRALREYAARHRGEVILFTDVDVVALRPFSLLLPHTLDGSIRFMRAAMGCNTGVYLFRSGNETLTVLDAWVCGLDRSTGREPYGDQSVLNTLGLCRPADVLPEWAVASCCHELRAVGIGRFWDRCFRSGNTSSAILYHAICMPPERKLAYVRLVWARSALSLAQSPPLFQPNQRRRNETLVKRSLAAPAGAGRRLAMRRHSQKPP